MEAFWILLAGTVVLGPWLLAGFAFARATKALRAAEAAKGAAEAAWRAARSPSPGVEEAAAAAGRPLETALAPRAHPVPPPFPAPRPEARASLAPPPPLPPIPPAPASAPAPAAPPEGLEEKIALVWFTRAGALALLLGTGYFLKYAIDNEWLGPWGRIALAALGGAAALAAGEVLRPRTKAAWIHATQGAGLALLFLAGFGSHALYRLVAAGPAFAAVAAVALLGGALAVRHRAEVLLGIALSGGLLAPVLLSTGEDRPLALFGYLLALVPAALLVSARLGFRVVPWLAFTGAVSLAAGWYGKFFDVSPPRELPWSSSPGGRYHSLAARAVPLAAWVLLAASFLGAHERFRRDARRAWAGAWLAASLLFALAAPFALLHDRPLLAGASLSVAAAVAAALLARSGRLPLLLAAEAVALLLLAIGIAERRPGAEGAWIAAVALVAAVHLGAVAHAWLVRGDPPGPWLAAVAALAGLGFAAAAIELAPEGPLRAALVGGAGAAELALGAAVVRRARRHGSVLLGAALALLAGAAAFLFSGATVTVVWAALAAAAAALAAREGDRWWLAGAGVLFAAAVLRALAVDLPSIEGATSRFLWSAGREGRLEPSFLLNPRALGLGGVAAALLVAAAAVRRAPVFGEPPWRVATGALAAAGWALVATLAVTEARDLVLSLPSAPPAGDEAAFEAFRDEVLSARVAALGTLSMTASLVLAAGATLLLAGGFLFREPFHRWLGIGLFGIVLGKLVLSDVWRLSRLQQVAVFLAVGVLLLGAAFLYARHGRRIAALLSDGPPRPPAGPLLALLAAGALAGPARALDPSAFRFAREIEGVASPGLHALEADRELFASSRAAPGSLADVRIEGPGGAEVPWVLRAVQAPEPDRAVEGAVVDPVVLPDGSVRALVDLGPKPPRHGELRLDLAGDEFLRPVRIEVSPDGRWFGLLAEGGRVWAVRDVPGARRTWVRHPPSEARFVRVTILPGAGDPPRVLGASVAAGEGGEPPLALLDVKVPVASRTQDGRESVLDVDLGAAGLPVEAVLLEVGNGAFERRVRVLASEDGRYFVPCGGGVVFRALPGKDGRPPPEGLRFPAPCGGRRHLRIAIADGDSPPLRVTRVSAGWRPREIVFRATDGGRHVLLSGADVKAPAYDLASLLARGEAGAIATASLGRREESPRFREREEARPFTERHRGAIAALLAVLFAGLALWAVRLLRRPGPGA